MRSWLGLGDDNLEGSQGNKWDVVAPMLAFVGMSHPLIRTLNH